MIKRLLTMAIAAGAIWAVFAAQSPELRLYCSSERNLTWQTIASGTVYLALVWPEGATAADVLVRDVDGRATVRATGITAGTESYAWTVFEGTTPAADNCYQVNVTYRSGNDPITTDTAELALLRGTFAPIKVSCADSERAFARTRTGRPIAFDARWFTDGASGFSLTAENRATGVPVVFASDGMSSGYFRWNPLEADAGRDWFDMTLTAAGIDPLIGSAYLSVGGVLLLVR